MRTILYLFPTDKNQYLNFIYEETKKYCNNIYRFNFVEYSHQHGIRDTEKYIEDLISDKKIDILISVPFATDYQLSVEFYASLKNKVRIVFFLCDDQQYLDVYSKYYCQIADAVITGDYYGVYSYQKLGIPVIFYFTPLSKHNHYPLEITKDIDVSFLGDCTKSDRLEYINFLIENGIQVKTFGKGSKNGFVEWKEYSKIFSRSKINLNFTKIDKLSWANKDEPLLNRVRQGSKGRAGEISLTKSFCLSEYAHDLNFIFEIGKEIDVFHNKEELLEKIKFYLSNDVEREKIAANAYKKATNNYLAEITIPRILKELEDILVKNNAQQLEYNEIFLSRSFKIKSINGLTFSMFVLIKNKKILYALETFIKLFRYGFFIFLAGFYGGAVRVIKNITAKIRQQICKRKL